MRQSNALRFLAVARAAILSLATLVAAPVTMAQTGDGPPPAWFVDESKLPFTALPGATAYWGVHTGADSGPRYPRTGTVTSSSGPTASGGPGSSSPWTTIPSGPS